MRVDVMSKLRGVEPFPVLWERRTTLADADGTHYELLALPDLVQAKKTQRSKDWPMLQRLLEAHFLQHRLSPTDKQVQFWLRELRTPELLSEAAGTWRTQTDDLISIRPLLRYAQAGQRQELVGALKVEEQAEREADRQYWQPLKAELERLRRAARESDLK
jgi:hypothetical protein